MGFLFFCRSEDEGDRLDRRFPDRCTGLDREEGGSGPDGTVDRPTDRSVDRATDRDRSAETGLDGAGEAGRCEDPFLTGGRGDTPESAPGAAGSITTCDLEGAVPTDEAGDFDVRPGVFDDDRRCPSETGEGLGVLDFLRSLYLDLALKTSHCSWGHSLHCQQVVVGVQSRSHFLRRQCEHIVWGSTEA